ncbi:MAG: hypothetical protein M3P06_14195 [Acidobacteriota bacterium]|nr:hypothetical protein [Acidobacteriota bacterium]
MRHLTVIARQNFFRAVAVAATFALPCLAQTPPPPTPSLIRVEVTWDDPKWPYWFLHVYNLDNGQHAFVCPLCSPGSSGNLANATVTKPPYDANDPINHPPYPLIIEVSPLVPNAHYLSILCRQSGIINPLLPPPPPARGTVTISIGSATTQTMYDLPADRDSCNTVILDYTVPAADPGVFSFDVQQTSSARVLTHKYGPDDYPTWKAPDGTLQALQTADGKIEVRGTVKNGQGLPLAGRSVYFRVIDPPDSAAYVVNAGDAKVDDNAEGPGILMPTTATSNTQGRVTTTLTVADHSAGDNYQVEASLDPKIITDASYVCAAGCVKSGIFTAWKRVYVEMNTMAKKGAFITKRVQPGHRKIEVSDVRHFEKGDRVRLLHAPPVEGTGEFYDEEVTVQHVEGKKLLSVGKPEPGILFLYDPNLETPSGDIIGKAYEWRDLAGNRYRSYLADAVIRVTGNPNLDFYRMSAQERRLVRPLFEEAFTETMFLVDDPELGASGPLDIKYEGVVPFFEEFALKNGNGDFDTQREWFGRKWMRQGGRADAARTALPNHQVVFLAAREAAVSSKGGTSVAEGFNDTWLFLESIDSAAVAREAIPHELAHQWLVNPVVVADPSKQAYGHCDAALGAIQTMFSHPGLMCSMTNGEFLYGSPEATDGVVGFHYKTLGSGQVDSEHLRIRQRAEPIPQTEKTGRIIK